MFAGDVGCSLTTWTSFLQFSVFTSHVIKTKNRNHSINWFKNLGYDRWLQYKEPRQESGLYFLQSRAVRRSWSSKFIELCLETPYFVPFGGTQTWRPWRNKNVCWWHLLLKWRFLSRALTHWNKWIFQWKDRLVSKNLKGLGHAILGNFSTDQIFIELT